MSSNRQIFFCFLVLMLGGVQSQEEPSPPPSTLPPCEEQFIYEITRLQCSENPSYQGNWIDIDLDPNVCSGYCNYSGAGNPPPSSPSTAINCHIEKLRDDCLNTKNGICNFEVIEASTCNVGCACVSADPPFITCEEILAFDKEACLQKEDRKTKCSFVVLDPSSCQGQCQCERSPREKKLRCKPIV